MQCEILTSETAVSALASEWEALDRRIGARLFAGYHWLEGWWRHLGEPGGFRLHVVAARRDGRLVGIAPLAVIRRKGVRIVQWAGAEVIDYGDFLLEDAAAAAPLWDAIRRSPHCDLARMGDMHPQAACLPALAAFARPVKTSQARNLRIEWPTFDAWFAHLPYSARKHYRARVKQAEALGPLCYDVARTQVPQAALDALIAQKKAWAEAQGKQGIFEASGVGAFFRHIIDAEERRGRLHFSTLSCGEEIIAAHLGFVERGAFLSYMPSYAHARSALSPGRILLFKCIGWAIENGCAEYDFMRGDEEYKNAFATRARALNEYMFPRTLLGRLAQHMYLRRMR